MLNNDSMTAEVSDILHDMFIRIGIDQPSNFEELVVHCADDVKDTADPEDWHEGDVYIAFRRWIESKGEDMFK